MISLRHTGVVYGVVPFLHHTYREDDMEIRNVKEEPALAVRTTTSVKELPNTVGRAYGAIVQYLGQQGKGPAGSPFVMYYNMDMEHLDVEIGFPVASPLPGNGVVHASKIPAGKAAFAVHTGPYATIETTYNALTAFMTERGLVPETWMYERYLNSPEDTPPERLLTEIYFPLKD